MYGIIHSQLKAYVVSKYDAATWEAVLAKAGLAGHTYVAGQAYPDAEILAIVSTASSMTGRPIPEILEEFGVFITPALVSIYKAFIKPQWRTLDFLENTEGAIHKAVHMRDKGAAPPQLVVTRPSATEALITYTSPRRMCAVAKGITRGVANHYAERISITDLECMHEGSSRCVISVKLVS